MGLEATKPEDDASSSQSGSSTSSNVIVMGAAAYTIGQIVGDATREYLDQVARNPLPAPSPRDIESQLLTRTNNTIEQVNVQLGLKGPDRFTRLKSLSFSQIAAVMIHFHHVVRIAPSGKNTDRDYDLLAVYCDKGEDRGLYVTSEDQILAIARQYNHELSIAAGKEVLNVLRVEAPRTTRNHNRDLVPVDNGVFQYDTKQLIDFDPSMVFLSKARVPYDPTAQSPVIHNPDDGTDWEVEAWMHELSDDDEIVELLWGILGAIVRPHVRWKKSAWFYSEQGNNGKGTLCELMRNLVGAASCASIPIDDFGKEFLLEPLVRASAIIVDENDVGTFVDKAANLKAIVTNDVISINRKHKVPISVQFWGFMVQCLNELPRIKDKSESFYRRQLFVPFTKSFTGVERDYIKEDYLSRPEVLRYVLKRVLHMNYHKLSEPETTKIVLAEYKEFNDPIRSFWEEFEQEFVWDLLPFAFLYDLYKSWFGKTNPSGSPVGRNSFIADLVAIVRSSTVWYCPDKNQRIRSGNRMAKPETLIAHYGLEDWKRKHYTGKDLTLLCIPDAAQAYRGLQRFGAAGPVAAVAAGAGDTTDPASDATGIED